jgi:FkbM family methyltransferase
MLIPFDHLVKKYKIPPKGIIHIGAHKAEEADVYSACGFKKVLWLEGNFELIPYLEEKIKNYSGHSVYWALIDIEEKVVVFHITNNLQSSSILKLKEHAAQYPSITVEKEVLCTTKRLDNFIRRNKIQLAEFNFLNLDIQGNELNALKSLGTDLTHFDYIYTEVQLTQLYENSPTIYEVDKFLFSKGYIRVETNFTYRSWGDALYIKNSSSNNSFKLLESRIRVFTWPLKKKVYRFFDQLDYYINKKLLKKNS